MSRKNICIRRAVTAMLVAGLMVAGASGQAVSAKKKIALSHKRLVLKVGQKKKLRVKNTRKKVRWSSKNKKIASVSKSGVVQAKNRGKVKIVARVGKRKYTCTVTVKNKKTVPVKSSATKTPASAKPGASPSPAPVYTSTPAPTPDPNWAEGKKSGTEEDYNKYFAVEMREYQNKQEGTAMGTVKTISYYSQVVGADREAYIYLPPGYSTAKKYPVLYLIHGIGCHGGQWAVSMNLNNIISNMISRGEVNPFVAVMPSVIPKEGLDPVGVSETNIRAFTLFEQEFLKDLEPYILNNYSVSSDRKDTGICGLSMGGMEALHLGFSIKEHFNYIGSFSAAPTLNEDLLTLEGCTEKPELVLLCSGTADGTVGSNPYNYHMKLEENQVDHIWYLYPKGGHDDRVWKNGLVNFLKRSY